jgi:RNA polymerase sigma-70 factor (ECF subfamily)
MSSAEDLTQETFMRGWQGLARLEDGRSFGSWVLSIATHVGQEWLRRKITADRHRPGLARIAASRAEPRETEIDLPLAEALADLPPEYQDLLALRHGQGLSCEEIARETGRPLGTVTKTLSRAYARLRERLAGVRAAEGSPS